MRFYSSFFTIFWYHSIIDKAEAQNVLKNCKLNLEFPYINWFFFHEYLIFPKNAQFHSTFSTKTLRFTPRFHWICFSSENAVYCGKRPVLLCVFTNNDYCNSAFLPKTLSFTPRFTENAQYDPKTHSLEDNTKFNFAFSATALSFATCFWWKQRVIKTFEYLGEFEKYF
jgi:hypothetical protein